MPKIPTCKRCGADVTPRACAPNKRFCSVDCYDSWWLEFRTKHFTVADVVAKRDGPPPDVRLNDVQATWLAAMIDGEGTIGIYRIASRGRSSGFIYRAAIAVANTDRRLVERVADLVSAGICIADKRIRDRHKPLYHAQVKSRFIVPLLEAIRPHLVIKGQQADNVLAFCAAKAAAPMRSSQDAPIFEELYQANRLLNRRGPKE